MKQSKSIIKKLVLVSVIMMILGLGVSFLGYSLSGFDASKYQTDHKRWYQVISIPKN